MADTVIRIKRQEGFTVLPNGLLRDPRLTLKTKGLFCMMLSFPEDWTFSVGGLMSVCDTGRDAIRSALRELEEAGYLERERTHSESGRFGGSVYTLHEVSSIPLSENPPMAENIPMSGFPTLGEPTSGEPTSENPQVQNKDYINTPYSPPEGDGGEPPVKAGKKRVKSGPKKQPDWKPERFAKFWDFYPRGESKQAAIRAWDKLKPPDELIDTMAMALVRQVASEEWQRGIGIPYASTWLNQARWEDTPKDVPRETPQPAPLRGQGVTYL